MKKIVVIMLSIVMVFALIAVTACAPQATTVRIKLYVTADSTPIERNHTIGQDDLPAVTNGNLTFKGWYYDKDCTQPYSNDDTDIASGTALYAKWENSQGGIVGDKVVLTLNLNYSGSTPIVRELDKNSATVLPTPARSGYTFGGWYTETNGNGIKWDNSMAISSNMTLYAHWTSGGSQGGEDTKPVDISDVLKQYDSNWNFAVTVTVDDGEGGESIEYYEYRGDDILNTYSGSDGSEYTEYLSWDNSNGFTYYYDNGDGTYTAYDENSNEFDDYYSYSYIIDMSQISSLSFVQSGTNYAAANPTSAGNAVLGDYGINWNSFIVTIVDGKITKIVGEMSDGYTMTYEFSKYGQVNFTLPEASTGGSGSDLPTEPTGTMDNQVYDKETFDNSNLQDQMKKDDGYIGLPSQGTFNALVIPVQFSGDTISQQQLENLNIAFNGTSAQTGWESVKTFYQKSSYGKLNITFDIADVYESENSASYYSKYSEQVDIDGDIWTKDGSAKLLEEVLAYYASRIDLTKYDSDGDGCIDAVYLIYSEEVDYISDDSFYWAYVTWYYGDQTFGGKDAFYYLFAGFDFMTENIDKMPNVKVNAETYIHETGHLLGLDDYYDYDENSGSNLGLGGADMMDYNVGDHGVYSKIMLGWLTPEIITSSKTVTIQSSQAGGYAILIPLNWNNSYFCEYLLIDLYTATGLNEMGSQQTNTILYDGAEYGVRIYHVASSINNPYNDEYGSFTDNNNSVSGLPLIKLVEADGETSKSTEGSWASQTDLWQTGDSLSEVFPQYMRYDGKLLNFNITIDSVSKDGATITITYNA